MLFKKKRKDAIELTDRRGFTITMSLEGFNKIEASVDTDSEEFLIDAHMIVLKHYSALFNNKRLDFFTRQLLSIGIFKWNITKFIKKLRQ